MRFPLLFLLLLLITIPPSTTALAETEQSTTLQAPTPLALSDRYRQALMFDSENLRLRYYLGIALLTEQRFDEAIAEFRLAYPAFSDSVEANYNLGLAYYQAGDPDNALFYFEIAEDLGALDQPEIFPLSNAYYNLGATYLEKEANTEALNLFRKTLSIAPERTEIHRIIGDIHARNGSTASAEEAYNVYLASFPNDTDVHESLFTIHYNNGLQFLGSNNLSSSRESFQKALYILPESPLALYYLGYLDYSEGLIETASEKLRRVLALSEDEEIHKNVAELLHSCATKLLKQRKPRKALEALQPLTTEEPPALEILCLAGNIHLNLKEFNTALSYFDKVLKIDPSHPDATNYSLTAQTGAIDELFEAGKKSYNESFLLDALTIFKRAFSITNSDYRINTYLEKTKTALKEAADKSFKNANQLLAEDPQKALNLAREGLTYNPTSEDGKTLERQAINALDKLVSKTLEEGDILLAESKLEEAEKSFRRVLDIEPVNTHATSSIEKIEQSRKERMSQFLAEASSLLEEGNLPDARTTFKRVLIIDPNSLDAKRGIERLEAIADSMTAEEIHWGRLAKNSGKFQQAREHFSKALQIKDSPLARKELEELETALLLKIEGLFQKATEALGKNDFKHATRYYQGILALDPENTEVIKGLSNVREMSDLVVQKELVAAKDDLTKGNTRKAIDRYRTILDLDPVNTEAQKGLTRSKSLLAKTIEDLISRGNSSLDKGDFSAAETAFNEALGIDPYHTRAKTGLQKITQLKSSGIKQGDETRLYLQGIEFYTQGKYDDALAVWEQVLILVPQHEKARMNIEKARRKKQQIEEIR